jgi:uncharacterized protein (DUF1697 family)
MQNRRRGVKTRAVAGIHLTVPTYVALLRGINVGGRNPVKMGALVSSFEAMGFESVATYIQSGNVVFRSATRAHANVARQIEEMLSRSFGFPASIVMRSLGQMRAVVENAPKGFGADPVAFRYDVIFLKEPLRAESVLPAVPTRPGVDTLVAGRGVLYATRLVSRASESRLTKVVSLPIYRSMTIRNWNTTTTLLRMMDDP